MTLAAPATRALARLPRYLRVLVERSPRLGPMLMALFVGFLTGLDAIAFAELVDLVEWFTFDLILDDWLEDIPHWKIILAPTLGGLLVGR